MFLTRRRRTIVFAALALTAAVLPAKAVAQPVRQAKVALVATLADTSALATIVRSPGPNSATTILLRERDANAETLASAMTALLDSREKHGEEPSHKIVINLHGHKSAASLTPNERRLGELYLARLRNAQLEPVAGVGQARATTIALAAMKPHGLQ